MNPTNDLIIVGAGIAGACAALYLSRQARVLVLEAEQPAAGASGAAAGLVNPMMGRRARRIRRAGEALDALHEILDLAGATALLEGGGVLRPARHAQQAQTFREAAATHPDVATWLPADQATPRFPDVIVHEGALLVQRGGAVRVPEFVEALLAAAQRHGAEVRTGARVTGWGETTSEAFVELDTGERRMARHVLLALGYSYRHHPELAALNLHGVKGQTARIAPPDGLTVPMPLSGYGYVVPDGDTLIVGSSYQHDFADLEPSDEQTRRILAKASRMLPGLAGARVLNATAGVRVTVPGSRRPLLGPLPGRSRLWVFTGLGSKGLLTAPLLARHLPAFLKDPTRIPKSVQVTG